MARIRILIQRKTREVVAYGRMQRLLALIVISTTNPAQHIALACYRVPNKSLEDQDFRRANPKILQSHSVATVSLLSKITVLLFATNSILLRLRFYIAGFLGKLRVLYHCSLHDHEYHELYAIIPSLK
jgi:hypothetical protein